MKNNNPERGRMLKAKTTRFGELEVPEEDIILFKDGLLGFPEARKFVILNDPTIEPLRWLQSLDEQELAFVIIDPLRFRNEYGVDLSDSDVESLELSGPEEAMLYAIVVIPRDKPEKMTANLQGPIVINAVKKLARQVISSERTHCTKHYVLEEMKQMLASEKRKSEKSTSNIVIKRKRTAPQEKAEEV
jgi:flagellar assembly factor FliW